MMTDKKDTPDNIILFPKMPKRQMSGKARTRRQKTGDDKT